jgi:hypothetical protein
VTARRRKARWTSQAAAAARIIAPVTSMVMSKIAADGCSTTLSGGRVPPRSLMAFSEVL